jgi:murein tripeptide amidase MpaA
MELYHYYTNEDLTNTLETLQKKYPNLLEVRKIGDSYQNRPIYLMVITNLATGPDQEKPAVWIDANIHATEITGTTTALAIAYELLSKYGIENSITHLLDQTAYYIVPRINPDGAQMAMADNPKYLRSGVRAYPYPDKQEGLHVQDIDSDGRILQMRMPDPAGEWKINPEDPRLLVKRQPDDDEGPYFRLFSEGLLEDFDGYLIKTARPLEGLDFNRNFPFEWKPEADQAGAGPYPGSEPEIKALIDFIIAHPNINLALTYHTFSRVILRPYSTRPDEEMETGDLWTFQKIGERGTALTGYRCVSTFHDFMYSPKEVTTGAFDDWMYDNLGIFTYTVELWDLPTEAGIENRKFSEWFRNHPLEDDLKIIDWVDKNVGEGGYIDWYPFEHPQLGKIELGGWNSMYTWRNPPEKYLEPEVKRNVPFAISLGKMLPLLNTDSLQIRSLAPDTYHIKFRVENLGFLPTYTSVRGKQRSTSRPIRVEWELPPGISLLEGKKRKEIGHLMGRSHRLSSSAINASSPTDNRLQEEWVIKGAPGSKLKLHIYSERAGTIHHEITLENTELENQQ